MATSTLADQLADAETQYHELLLGRVPRVIVDQNGERVEFTAANSSKLYAYILQLRTLIAESGTPVSGPMRVIF